jgi:gluconolactonase
VKRLAPAALGIWLAACRTVPATNRQTPAPEAEAVAVLASTEGPTVDRDGNVYFTFGGITGGRILKWTDGPRRETQPGLLEPPGRVEIFREYGASGLIFDDQGRLLACERGPNRDRPGVTRTDVKTGKIEWLADRYQGKRFSGPNDLTIDAKGRVYFTDRPPMKPTPDETGINAVYRIDPDGSVARILAEPAIERPNGIVISPDDKILYLIEAHIAKGGAKLVRAYDLKPDGTVTNMRVFHNFAPGRSGDGMTIDTQGNLYIAAGLNMPRGTDETLDTKAGIYVISPVGKLLRFIPIPEDLLTNVAFGGPEMKTLYVTAGKTLFRVRVEVPGTGR